MKSNEAIRVYFVVYIVEETSQILFPFCEHPEKHLATVVAKDKKKVRKTLRKHLLKHTDFNPFMGQNLSIHAVLDVSPLIKHEQDKPPVELL